MNAPSLSNAAGVGSAGAARTSLPKKLPAIYLRLLKRIFRLIRKRIPENRLGDRTFSFFQFVLRHKRLPGELPLFNDAYYRLKISDELFDPLRVFVTDKEFLKTYVKSVVGDEYNVPTLAVLRNRLEVDRYEFPAACCIKPTHYARKVIIRKNGEPIDLAEIKRWFSLNLYKVIREVNYKHLKPKVIVEPLVFGDANIKDYKIFCYQGTPRLIQADIDSHTKHTRKYFDCSWNELDFSLCFERSHEPLGKPDNLGQMLAIATKLSANFPLVRIDLYSDGRQCLVSEITNCHGNVAERFIPLSAEAVASRIIFG
jgi:hypothetical protein